VQTSEQKTGVAVAHVELAPRSFGQIGERRFRDPVGAIAAAGKPHGIHIIARHDLPQRREPRLVRPREMAVRKEALRMDDQLAIAPLVDNRLDCLGGFALQRAAWGDHGNAHRQPLCVGERHLRNRREAAGPSSSASGDDARSDGDKTAAVPVTAPGIILPDDEHVLASIGPAMPIRAAVESTATAVAGLGR